MSANIFATLATLYAAALATLEDFGGDPIVRILGSGAYVLEDFGGQVPHSREGLYVTAINTPDGLAIDPADGGDWIVSLHGMTDGNLYGTATAPKLSDAYLGAFADMRATY